MTTNGLHRTINGTRHTLEWLWRIAALVIVPLLIWVATTLKDVDQRVGVLENQTSNNTRVIASEVRRGLEHERWGRNRSEELAAQVAGLTEAVRALNNTVDRLNTKLDRMEGR